MKTRLLIIAGIILTVLVGVVIFPVYAQYIGYPGAPPDNSPSVCIGINCAPQINNNPEQWKIGYIQFSQSHFSELPDKLSVRVVDYDMNNNPNKSDKVAVDIWSKSDPKGIQIELFEIGSDIGIFEGDVPISTIKEKNSIMVSNDDLLTGVYLDGTLPPTNSSQYIGVVNKSTIGIYPITYSETYIKSPLSQIKSDTRPYLVQCKDDLVLVIKIPGDSAACVKPENIARLIDRGWANFIHPITLMDSQKIMKEKYATHSTLTVKLDNDLDIEKIDTMKRLQLFSMFEHKITITENEIKQLPKLQEAIESVGRYKSFPSEGYTFISIPEMETIAAYLKDKIHEMTGMRNESTHIFEYKNNTYLLDFRLSDRSFQNPILSVYPPDDSENWTTFIEISNTDFAFVPKLKDAIQKSDTVKYGNGKVSLDLNLVDYYRKYLDEKFELKYGYDTALFSFDHILYNNGTMQKFIVSIDENEVMKFFVEPVGNDTSSELPTRFIPIDASFVEKFPEILTAIEYQKYRDAQHNGDANISAFRYDDLQVNLEAMCNAQNWLNYDCASSHYIEFDKTKYRIDFNYYD
jgi:hypothetical protein